MKAKWWPKTRRFPLGKASTVHLDVFTPDGSLCRPGAWGMNRTYITAKVTCKTCLWLKSERDAIVAKAVDKEMKNFVVNFFNTRCIK